MSSQCVHHGIGASRARTRNIRIQLGAIAAAGCFALTAPAFANPSGPPSNCTGPYDPTTTYPTLPAPQGADVSGEDEVTIHLHDGYAVVDLDGCYYEVDRDLEIDHGELDFVTLSFELEDFQSGGQVFVTDEDEVLIETLLPSSATTSRDMGADEILGFEYGDSSDAPTRPVIVTKPTSGNPDPE